MTLSGEQFDLVDQGDTPLQYQRGYSIRRLAAVHPDVPPAGRSVRPSGTPRSVESEYWHPEVEVGRSTAGKPLKKTRVIQNPQAAAPGTASFLDYEDRGSDVYVHYMNTRTDMTKRGLGNRLIDRLAEMHPDRTINFGQIESSHVYNMKQRLARQGRSVAGDDRGFFG